MHNAQLAKNGNIVIRREADSSSFGKVFEPGGELMLSVCFVMVVRAMRFLAVISVKTWFNLKVIGVEFLFFPAVAEWASVFRGASIFVGSDEVFGMPVAAHFFRVGKD